MVYFALKLKYESGWHYNGSMLAYDPVTELRKAFLFNQLSHVRQHPLTTKNFVEDHKIVRVKLEELDEVK